MTKKYYELLEIPENASESEIKIAYRNLARKWHPDKNPDDPQAEEKFKEIKNAYDVLIDPQKRELYNRYGDDMNQHLNGVNEGGFGGFPFDMRGFEKMFGGMHGMHGMRRQEPDIPSLRVAKEFTTDQLYDGGKFKETITRFNICKKCLGKGTHDGKEHPCTKCRGTRMTMNIRQHGNMIIQQPGRCDRCINTNGIEPNVEMCQTCNGKVAIEETAEVEFTVKPGSYGGMEIIIENYGNEIPEGERKQNRSRSDVIIIIQEKPNDDFIRMFSFGDRKKANPADLLHRMKISLAESICGLNRKINHIANKTLYVKYNEMLRHNDIIVIKNEGMPKLNNDGTNSCGDLYILIEVERENLTKNVKNRIWQILTETPYPQKDKTNDITKDKPINTVQAVLFDEQQEKESDDEYDENDDDFDAQQCTQQ